MTHRDAVTVQHAGVPSLASAPIGIPGAPVVPPPPGSSSGPTDKPRPLRIGDKVRSFVDDVCVSVGLTGLVVNVAPPRYRAPVRARILWENDTVSMADSTTFEVVPKETEQEPSSDEPKAS